MCVHDTDSRGFCTKNGPHCAFAHGNHDLRPPVYDINEQKVYKIIELSSIFDEKYQLTITKFY